MYQVLPEGTRVKKAPRELSKKVNEVLAGTPARPFGLYDFLITITVAFWYFFLTGLAIVFKRDIPAKWLSIGFKLDGGNIVKNMKKKVLKDLPKKESSLRVEDIHKTPPTEIIV